MKQSIKEGVMNPDHIKNAYQAHREEFNRHVLHAHILMINLWAKQHPTSCPVCKSDNGMEAWLRWEMQEYGPSWFSWYVPKPLLGDVQAQIPHISTPCWYCNPDEIIPDDWHEVDEEWIKEWMEERDE